MIRRALPLLAAVLFHPSPALATPPFVTDDAEVLAPGEAEIVPYLDAVSTPVHDTGEAGIDLSLGVFDGVQLGVVVPFHAFKEGRDRTALGELSVATKIVLAERSDGRATVAFGPLLAIPTGAGQRLQVGVDLPLHATIRDGEWEFDLGAGYRFQADEDGGGLPFGGIVARRTIGPRLMLGIEAYAEGSRDGGPMLMAGPGVAWTVADRLTLVAAGHAVLTNRTAHGNYHFFAGLVVTP